MNELSMRWSDDEDDVDRLIDFFISHVDERYISHGEIMDGRAVAPGRWGDELRSVLRREFEPLLGESDAEEPRMLLVEDDEELVALGVIEFLPNAYRPFGVLHDLVVHRERRGAGIGSRIYVTIEQEARKEGLATLFLETGLANDQARSFFGRLGFEACSQTMIKPIA